LRKKKLTDWKKLLVISFEPTDLKLVDVPATYLFDGENLFFKQPLTKVHAILQHGLRRLAVACSIMI
jgi:hypothetical protein